MRPARGRDDSPWYVQDSHGFAWLPYCSPDFRAKNFFAAACLSDPESPICRAHRQFFQSRKERA